MAASPFFPRYLQTTGSDQEMEPWLDIESFLELNQTEEGLELNGQNNVYAQSAGTDVQIWEPFFELDQTYNGTCSSPMSNLSGCGSHSWQNVCSLPLIVHSESNLAGATVSTILSDKAARKRENDRRYRDKMKQEKLQMKTNIGTLIIENECLKRENASLKQLNVSQAKVIDQLRCDLNKLELKSKQNDRHDLDQLENKRLKLFEKAALRQNPSMDHHLPYLGDKFNIIRILDLSGYHNLKHLPDGLDNLNSLTYLDVSDCHLLAIMPKNIATLSQLRAVKGLVISDKENSSSFTELASGSHQQENMSIIVRTNNFGVQGLEEEVSNLKKLDNIYT